MPDDPPDRPAFGPDQIVTVFRSRLRPDNEAAYHDHAARMAELARTMPGLVEFKSFTADDGERVTLVTFADAGSQNAWGSHPDHRDAQRHGRSDYYAEYSLQICRALRVSTFRHQAGAVS